jgi:hypothetical protein
MRPNRFECLFARLLFVRLEGPHNFGFAPMGVPACSADINDGQQHHHESIGKEPAISQHKNVTEGLGLTFDFQGQIVPLHVGRRT